MSYFLLQCGGSSYGGGSVNDPRDIKETATEAEAEGKARAFWNGYGWGGGATPCAEDVTFYFYRSDPRGKRDPYPDEVWTRDDDGDPIREIA